MVVTIEHKNRTEQSNRPKANQKTKERAVDSTSVHSSHRHVKTPGLKSHFLRAS